MTTEQRNAVLALSAAGALWGLTVALSKLSIAWLGPSWVTVGRFLCAAPVLAIVGRRRLREALTPRVALMGALGFGVVILLQNLGIARTSASDAALIVGAVPVLVALIAAGLGQATAGHRKWLGYGLAVVGIALVAHGGGGGATAGGDLLVFGSVVLSAVFIALQPRVLDGRDPAAVTAIQFAAGGLVALPVALLTGGVPHAPVGAGPALAFGLLVLAGTVLPFWLFAFGQARVSADLAGAFVNLEPLVGAVVGWVGFHDAPGSIQIAGSLAVLIGIVLSILPSTGRATNAPERADRAVLDRRPTEPFLAPAVLLISGRV